MGLLTVNLVVCSMNRLPSSLRLYRRKPELERPGLYEDLPPEQVLAVKGSTLRKRPGWQRSWKRRSEP